VGYKRPPTPQAGGRGHGGRIEFSPTDLWRRPAPPAAIPGGDRPPSRPLGPTLETGEYPEHATSLG
jgi:hypothetical protein